ncbi:MAG: four helix bundle protein [Deltaproteobacteria bacterium]|nr:four helix bundle protein [Deltaproteobacteria bacterium]
MRDHRSLRVFELADEVALLIYRTHREFSNEEVYGLTSQMRRVAISVPSNIVEGCPNLINGKNLIAFSL